ncbi:hypothetical protein C8F01DRAFT_1176625, partial [Mycena amicta]
CTNDDSRPHFRQCSGCSARLYCSIRCQQEDWKVSHRDICSLARTVRLSLLDTFSSSDLRSIQRVLHGDYL